MKLVEFSVTNFRSITKAYKIPFQDLTILVGKNNEGKSNMLKALNISMTSLEFHSKGRTKLMGYNYPRYRDDRYIWERDFPISLQNTPSGHSIFRVYFHLDGDDLLEFRDKFKSNLNGNLPIEIKIGRDNIPHIKVVKNGKGSGPLNKQSQEISAFIGKKIQFNYIPAIRTDKQSLAVVENILSERLKTIEDNPDYVNALETIRNIQKPIIDKLSLNIKDALKDFLPNIRNVSIEVTEDETSFRFRDRHEIFIDDGTKTNLEFKGDGVKSLAALGLLKNLTTSQSELPLIAIEEPESHLHPGAIHILKDTIYDLSKNHQVIVSTHNPLFVNRHSLKSNILIDCGEAKPAKDIKELRDILGIKPSDNLVNASFVLVVEGQEDVVSLEKLLPHLSNKIAKALKNHQLVIEKIGGASNLSYKLTLLSHALCSYHVLLDNDDSGREAYEKAIKENSLQVKDVTFIRCKGMVNSEFEDCLNPNLYMNELNTYAGSRVDLCPEFKSRLKWSDRIKECFLRLGKPWNNKIEKEVKTIVANSLSKDLRNSLNSHKRNSIDSLVINLENVIEKLS